MAGAWPIPGHHAGFTDDIGRRVPRWDVFAGLGTARRLLVKAAAGVALALLLTVGVPAFLGIPLRAIVAFTPDLGLVMIAASALAVADPWIEAWLARRRARRLA